MWVPRRLSVSVTGVAQFTLPGSETRQPALNIGENCPRFKEYPIVLLAVRTQATQTAALLGFFAQHRGCLSQVRAPGLSLKPVQRLIDRGEVEAVQKGVYRLTAADLPPHADLVKLKPRVP